MSCVLSEQMQSCLKEMYERRLNPNHTIRGRDHWDAEPELVAKSNTLHGLKARGYVEFERGFMNPNDTPAFGTYYNKWRLTDFGIKTAESLVGDQIR
jgi:hypothetical protein